MNTFTAVRNVPNFMDLHGPSIQRILMMEVTCNWGLYSWASFCCFCCWCCFRFKLSFRYFSINTDAINSVWSGFGVFLGGVFLRVCAVYKTWYFKLIIISYKYFSALLYFLKYWQDNLKINVIFFQIYLWISIFTYVGIKL